MIYVINFVAALFVLIAAAMFFAFYRSRHVGLLIMAMTYAMSGLLAFALPHWWPLITGFVLVWLLRLLGLEPKVEIPEEAAVGGEEKKLSQEEKTN